MTKKTLDNAANRLRRRKFSRALVACSLVLTAVSIEAVERKLLPDGSLHTVSVDPRTGPGLWGGGTKIVDRVQKPDGTTDIKTVTGTDDRVLEADPSLSVSPVTGLPVLVYTRQDDTDTDVYFTMYDGIRWTSPQFLSANERDDRKPLIVAGRSGYLHVMWEAATGVQSLSTFYQTVLDAAGSPILLPVESNTPAETALAPPGGNASPGIFGSDILFAFMTAPPLDKQKIICFGGSDDPVPVLHRLEFVLSESEPLVDHVKIERVGTQLVVLAHQQRSMLYSVGSQAGWSPLRSISLDSISEERGELLIKELVARSAPR